MRRRPTVDPAPYESGTWGTPERPCPTERTLAAHLDGELTDAADAQVDAHIDRCSLCAAAHRQLEGLSGLLKGWEMRRARVEAPPRLATRVLREIAPEGLALRRETAREARRSFVAVAAAAAVLVGAFLAGRVRTEPSRAGTSDGDATFVASAPRSPLAPSALASLAVPAASVAPFTVPALERELLDAARGRAKRPLPSVFADDAAASALASWAPHLAAQDRAGELACVIDQRTVPLSALSAFERTRRRSDWYAERALRAAFSPTRDPSAQGTALSDRLPGLDAGTMARVLAQARASVPASRAEGGVLLWGLPEAGATEGAATGSVESPPEGAPSAGAVPETSSVLDLAAAADRELVRFRPDVDTDRASAVLEVAPRDASILVPSGELLTGGAGDRVVSRGTWIRASAEAQVVVLPCRPLSRHADPAGGAPRAYGAVAGPGLRAALRGDAPAEAILAIVDGQLADAGFPAHESLLALYRDDAGKDPVGARARALLDALGSSVAGFLAADPSGRFQGIEATDLPPPAGRRFLERLLAGYLLEARSRSSLDGSRPGAHVELVLGVLSSGTLRLEDARRPAPGVAGARASAQASAGASSSSGAMPKPTLPATGTASPAPSPGGVERLDEPRTGVRVEALTRPGARRATHLSGSIPEVR